MILSVNGDLSWGAFGGGHKSPAKFLSDLERFMIYFDHAATSYPKPPLVLETVQHALLEAGGNPGRSGHHLALQAAEEIYAVREALCNFFEGDQPEQFIFTSGATHALNLAIKTALHPGDHVLISDLEHNAVFRPVYRLFRDGLCTFSTFKTAGNILQNISAACTPKTRMLICTHVSNVSGKQLPLKEIGAFCRKKNIHFIADISQSAGHMPCSFRELQAHAVCAPAHKGLWGLQGAGFVYLGDQKSLPTFMEGGSGSHSLSPEMPDVLPDRFEAGTPATPAIVSMGAGLAHLKKAGGVRAVEAHEYALCRRACDMLSTLPGATVYGNHITAGPISFNLPHRTSEEVAFLLDKEGICVRGGFHCAPLAHRTLDTGEYGAVRISFGLSNTMTELEDFYRAIKYIHRS